MQGLTQLYVLHLLFLVAIMALQCACLLVYNVEYCGDWLVVSDALWVVAFHDSAQFVGRYDLLLLYHFVVANDVQDDVGRNYREARYFIVGEELVAYLDDSLAPYLGRTEVVANGNRG